MRLPPSPSFFPYTTLFRSEYLRQACEASLRALGVEAIGLYQFHRPDPKVPFAESVGAMAELKAAGKVRLVRSEEHTSELQSRLHLVCRLLLEKKNKRSQLQ